MKSYKSKDVFLDVPGRGDIYVVEIVGTKPPRHGDKLILDGKEVRVRTCEKGMRPQGYLMTVDEIQQP